jgi:hypothetical protein
MITGQVLYPANTAPADLSVYAVNEYSSFYGTAVYAVTRVIAPETTYRLVVPPGVYFVVARLDGDPLSAGGFTVHIACSTAGDICGGNETNFNTPEVRVDSAKVIAGINVGDWGSNQARRLIWDIDMFGSPASFIPNFSPLPKSLAARSFPPASIGSTQTIVSPSLGLTLQLPAGWHTVIPPANDNGDFSETYFSNESAASPLGMDSGGIWLAARIHFGYGCPFPDWRYATARATVKMQGASNHFFFEDPQPRQGPQPFTGYSVRGGDSVFGNCAEFIMTGTTQLALDDNLAAFAALVETAVFTTPCPACTSTTVPQPS